jgi:hypothetical protein
MENLRYNEQRAKYAIAMIWIVLAMDILSLISGYMQYSLLQGITSGTGVSMEEASANDSREQIVSILHVAALIISAITFIQWFRRAYFNLHQKVENLSATEGWAAGSWFVPVLCLYRPYQIMKELYVETKALLVRKELISEESLKLNVLGWWWGFWIAANIIGQISFRLTLNAETVDQITTCTMLSMISDLISIPLAFMAVKVIKDYAAVESMLHDLPDDEAPMPEENSLEPVPVIPA